MFLQKIETLQNTKYAQKRECEGFKEEKEISYQDDKNSAEFVLM